MSVARAEVRMVGVRLGTLVGAPVGANEGHQVASVAFVVGFVPFPAVLAAAAAASMAIA